MKTTEAYTEEPWLFTIEEQGRGFCLYYHILGNYMAIHSLEPAPGQRRTEIQRAVFASRVDEGKATITLDAAIRGMPCILEIPRESPPEIQDAAWSIPHDDGYHVRKALLQLAVQEIIYLATEGPSRKVPDNFATHGTRIWIDRRDYARKANAYNPVLTPLLAIKVP